MVVPESQGTPRTGDVLGSRQGCSLVSPKGHRRGDEGLVLQVEEAWVAVSSRQPGRFPALGISAQRWGQEVGGADVMDKGELRKEPAPLVTGGR